jgi:hypothetical protein
MAEVGLKEAIARARAVTAVLDDTPPVVMSEVPEGSDHTFRFTIEIHDVLGGGTTNHEKDGERLARLLRVIRQDHNGGNDLGAPVASLDPGAWHEPVVVKTEVIYHNEDLAK